MTSGLHHQTQISAPRPSSPVDLVPRQTRWIPDVRPFTSDLAAPDPNFSLSVPIASVPSSRSVPGMRPPTSLPTYPDSNRSPSFPTCWELRPAQSLVGDPSHSPSPQIQTSTPQSPPTRGPRLGSVPCDADPQPIPLLTPGSASPHSRSSHPAPRWSLRAPRGGWNLGDLAVIAETVEACLPSPWKPWRRAPGGASVRPAQARGRPSPQLPAVEHRRRSREPCCSRLAQP